MPEVHTVFIGAPLAAVIAIVAGILILLIPRILSYIVAFYLIIIGILGLIYYFR